MTSPALNLCIDEINDFSWINSHYISVLKGLKNHSFLTQFNNYEY